MHTGCLRTALFTLKEKKRSVIFIKARYLVAAAGLAAAMFMPLFFSLIRNVEPLNGAAYAADLSDVSKEGLLDGTSQSILNTYVSENLPGRDPMIRLRNQLIYSLFDKSTNQNMIVCRDKFIFEKSFLYRYEKIEKPTDEETVRTSFDRMRKVRDLLRKNGKELYLFITPSKPRYLENKVDPKYRALGYYRDQEGNYETLKRVLSDYDFQVFDAIEYIDGKIGENAEIVQYPLFQPTGTHWTYSIGLDTALAFAGYLKEIGGYQFPKVHQIILPTEEPQFPDADIYGAMNILRKPAGHYFISDLVLDEDIEEKNKPSVLMRGCSFMGQSLAPLITAKFFSRAVYMENTLRLGVNSEVSTFHDYDEIDLKQDLRNADFVIIELNEAHTYDIGMGMLEYILEHPEILN